MQEEILKRIDELVKSRFQAQEPQKLYEPISYTLSLGGKRLRPLLCCLATRLFRSDWEQALPSALALEVFHNFTLLHDDLMDHSPLRRGQETVYVKWDENTAILSGDVMSIEAYKALEELEDSRHLLKILPVFNQMAVDVCRGQQYDINFETQQEVTVSEYLEMIRLKTAVLIGASMRIGAIVGNATEQEAMTLDKIGQLLGLAFQIQDDYLDVYGDEATFGKPIGGDIMNAKKTLLLLYTKEHLDEEGLASLDKLMSLDETKREERINGVRALYDKAGADKFAKEEIIRLTDEAQALLSGMKLEEALVEPIEKLFVKLINRLS